MDHTEFFTTVERQSFSALDATTPLQFSGEFLNWAVVFLVIAIVAAVLGARGIAGISMTIAKWFVIIFLVLAVVSILL